MQKANYNIGFLKLIQIMSKVQNRMTFKQKKTLFKRMRQFLSYSKAKESFKLSSNQRFIHRQRIIYVDKDQKNIKKLLTQEPKKIIQPKWNSFLQVILHSFRK